MSIHLEVTAPSSSPMSEPVAAQLPSALAAARAAYPQMGSFEGSCYKERKNFISGKYVSYDP